MLVFSLFNNINSLFISMKVIIFSILLISSIFTCLSCNNESVFNIKEKIKYDSCYDQLFTKVIPFLNDYHKFMENGPESQNIKVFSDMWQDMKENGKNFNQSCAKFLMHNGKSSICFKIIVEIINSNDEIEFFNNYHLVKKCCIRNKLLL